VVTVDESDGVRRGERRSRAGTTGGPAPRSGAEPLETVPAWVLPAVVLGLTALAGGVTGVVLTVLAALFRWLGHEEEAGRFPRTWP
jgi:hypothetical protein